MSTRHVIDTLQPVIDAAAIVLAERRARRRGAPELADSVRRVSLAYRREAGTPLDLMRDPDAIDARLAFFLPRDLCKLDLPLQELELLGALPAGRPVRVLDLGAGLGTSGLGAARYLLSDRRGARRAASVHIDAVDADDEALRVAERLVAELAKSAQLSIELRAQHKPLERVLSERTSERYDLVLLGFVLNELPAQDYALALTTLCERLAPGGALIVLEPALRDASRALQRARDQLVARAAAPHVIAPCLHARPCPMLERERDWCHARLPLALPESLAQLARAAGLRDEDLTFSYLTLRNEPRAFGVAAPIDQALYRVVGGPIGSKGKLELQLCGAGPVRLLRRLDRHASSQNAAIEAAHRGAIVALEADSSHGSSLAVRAETRVGILRGPHAIEM
jgi:ribosomal protein RSM22 (predicted rRNA methylase)